MQKDLKRGEYVEVKSAKEILATLDKDGTLDALPFMPEMLQFCGRRFKVDKRVEKFCDTIKRYRSRRMQGTVMLEDLRCDGSCHDGCQAECRIFWKESWLRQVRENEPTSYGQVPDITSSEVEAFTSRNIKKQTTTEEGKSVDLYRCQATELYKASTGLSRWDPRPYVREFTTGNVEFREFLRVSARAFVEEPLDKLRILPQIWLRGTRTTPVPAEPLDLQPGEWVQVKTKEEIASMLTPEGRERGLWFDREMLPYCGGTYQVRKRVKRFIHDRDGRMIEFKKECITLEGVVCSGELSVCRYFCPRAIYPFWRENWLRRVSIASVPEGTNRREFSAGTGPSIDESGTTQTPRAR
jgi:hypothetical protein